MTPPGRMTGRRVYLVIHAGIRALVAMFSKVIDFCRADRRRVMRWECVGFCERPFGIGRVKRNWCRMGIQHRSQCTDMVHVTMR